ncbi:MAG: PAS domain-containing protein [Candidatus Bathyarchaeota archaeon]|nr:PAS domain-containing protein [Candidatus Bathyarchaeota archaeon]
MDDEKQQTVPSPTGFMQFENGALFKEQLAAMLNFLPVEITFIDENDTVRYFNQPQKMIFMRTKAIIGRKVQNCHPAKSLDTVNKIVESFKNGKKSLAEFWINLNNRIIYIRFYAIRNPAGKYLGTMEVVQDITEARALQGERRLLDWTD